MATVGTALNIPTQASVGRNSHAASINAFNLQLRQQPWYQQWFASQGLNPNQVHLSQDQRKQLQQVIIQRGGVPADAFNDMKIDPAGNLNTEHGFASQPTWLKALEIGAVATGAAFAAPGSIESLVGMGGSSAPGTVAVGGVDSGLYAAAPTILTGAGPLAASSLPTIAGPLAAAAPVAGTLAATAPVAGHTVGTALGLGLTSRDIVKAAIPTALSAVTGIYGARAQASAADKALAAQTQSQAAQLQYLKDVEAQRQKEFAQTQALNLDQYNQGQARLAPYRNLGASAVAQFGRPIGNIGNLLGVPA